MLESTVYRQVSGFGGQAKWTRLFDVAATLFYGLVKNHCFYDANKRTAFLTILFQLYKKDFCPAVSEKEIEDFTVEVAEDSLGKYSRYRDLKKSGDPDPEVRYISYWFKKNMRPLDRKKYTITYRELQTILNRYGFYLENPHGNTIDIIRYKTEKPRFGIFGKERQVSVRIGNIGFPRWTAQVLPDTLKYTRRLTNLRQEDGVDSGAFFDNFDAMQSLITTYNAPLMSLAHR